MMADKPVGAAHLWVAGVLSFILGNTDFTGLANSLAERDNSGN